MARRLATPMSRVALLLAILMLTAMVPASASTPYDECRGPTADQACVALDLTAAPTVGTTFYVWAAAAECFPGMAAGCAGRPAEPGSLGPVPAPVMGMLGVLYEETNDLGGLQRFQIKLDRTIPPDAMLLV